MNLPSQPLLRDLVPDRFAALADAFDVPAYRARQVREWAFRHGVTAWDEMGNVPLALRQALAAEYDLRALERRERQVSRDGTRKFLFGLRDGHTIESVVIPMSGHVTFCLSTQVGCAMACTFCATARGGLVRNLTPGEIVEQILHLRDDVAAEPLPGHGDRQFNVVFMGMGEPLDNWESLAPALESMMHPDGLGMSRRRIQVSTSGPAAGLRRLVAENPGVGLTLSLGGSTDEERRKVMPVPGRTGLEEAVGLAAEYGRAAGRRVTVAWVVIRERTDRPEQAGRLAALLKGRDFKVNLIPWNPLDDSRLEAADEKAVLAFQAVLADAGVPTFIRASGGRDIDAACGQLRRKRAS